MHQSNKKPKYKYTCMFCGTLVSTSGCLHDHILLFMIAAHAQLIAYTVCNLGFNTDSQLFYVYSAMLLSVAYAGGKPFPGCIVPLLLREVEWFITSSQSCSHVQWTLDYPNRVYLELQLSKQTECFICTIKQNIWYRFVINFNKIHKREDMPVSCDHFKHVTTH